MKLFLHLTVCKQMIDVLIKLLVIYNNIWNHLTVQKNELRLISKCYQQNIIK